MLGLLPSRRADARRRLVAPAALGVAAVLVIGGMGPVAAVVADPIATATTLEVSATSLQAHHPLTLTATIEPIVAPDPAPPIVGTVAFKDVFDGDGIDLGSVAVVNGQATLNLSTLLVGTHVFTAEFTGDGTYDDSKSLEIVVEVTPDVVEASGVGVGLPTFYPKVDGYRDTLPVKGTRGEPLSVAITIRNSAGRIVRSASLSKAAGAYTWSWNGKNKAGALQPAGTYTVRQVLGDGYGTTTVTKTVKLSWKKLDWRSFTTSKTLSQATTGGVGWAGWTFKVPGATVYGKLTASVYAKGYGLIAIRNATCAGGSWDLDCFDAGKIFSGGAAWYSVGTPAKTHVTAAERVRVIVGNLSETSRLRLDKVRVTIKYAVLR